ncbi:MAG TPA: ParA family protein [Gammaproteobacteria bacterium]|nr:ParA family protein [Gammaproteobacteria bacterium]
MPSGTNDVVSRVIAVMNQKGGVGKTTTAVNLAHALALGRQRVLALDLDPQAHLTTALGADAASPGMDVVLLEGAPLADYRLRARDGLDLVPAGRGLANVEHLSEGGKARGMRLRTALDACGEHYDAVIIDCPPSAGLLGMNALFAASELLIPVSSDYLALHSLSRFMETLSFVEETLRRPLPRRVVMTRFHAQRRLAREVRERLAEYFQGRLLDTAIRENVALAECPSFGETIFEYQDDSHGAEDYRRLAEEMVAAQWH